MSLYRTVFCLWRSFTANLKASFIKQMVCSKVTKTSHWHNTFIINLDNIHMLVNFTHAIIHFINTHFDTCNSSQQESNPGSHWLELPIFQLLSYSCQSITSTFIIMYCIRDIEYSSLNNWQPHLCMCYPKSVRCNVDQKVLFITKEAMLCDFSDCKCYRLSCLQHCKCMFD